MSTSEINSITIGPRQSNFELLRILAMFLVIVIHADFLSTGLPSPEEYYADWLPVTTKVLFESISIVCVNVFILISGWFGIRPSFKSFSQFAFQCLFFYVGLYLLFLIKGDAELSIRGIAQCLCLTKEDDWFIKAYIGLYVISPILNKFIETSGEKVFRNTLIAFYIFHTLYGCSSSARFIYHGYSAFSFIGLYLLAAYVRRYGIVFYKWGGVIYLASVVLNTIGYIQQYYTHQSLPVLNYDNPLVILGALGLLLYFKNLEIGYSKVINWLGASSFAVYLFHGNPFIMRKVFIPSMQFFYENYSGLSCLVVMGAALAGIFLLAVLLDQPRKWLWKYLSPKINIKN